MTATAIARILIVDDEKAHMLALCNTLRDHGYVTEGFTMGAEALEALRQRQFDVLLTDLMMPGMDGVQLLAAALKIDPHVVGVLMTGKGTIETAVRAMQAGALDYVLKPLKVEALLRVLARALTVRQLRLEVLELRNTLAIHELNQAIAHTLDTNILLDKVTAAVLAQFEADEVSVMLLDEDGASLLVAAARGTRRETLLGTRVAAGTGVAGHVVSHREPFVLQGGAMEAGIAPLYPRSEIHTGLCMPLISRNKVIGVLNLNYTQRPRSIPFGQIQVLSIFANVAATALEAARLYEDERKTHSRYSQILDMAADGIISIDRDQHIVLFNRGAANMFGYSSDELLGRRLTVLLPEEVAEAHRGHVETFGQGPDESRAMAGRARLLGRRKDGGLLNVEVGISKHSEGGQPIYTAIVRDVTDRVALEDQLRQAQKMDAVGQLTGGIAHDFNNVLTVVMANAEALVDVLPVDGAHHEDLAELLAAAKRGAAMVARLLQFSRRGTLSPHLVRPGEVVENLAGMLRRLLPATIHFESTDTAGPATVLADVGAVEQVLVNLCTNARDAMPNGGTVRIECDRTWLDQGYHATHPWVTPGAYVCIAVTDTGTGMDEEAKRRVFEPFFTTKPAGLGTGLGMAMAYGVMKQHGGMVHVYSELGQGTTVRLYFPMAAEAEEEAAAAHQASGATQATRGNEVILLAEDETAIRRVTKRALEGKGYRVLVAEDGEEALEIYLKHKDEVALVISDLVMPKLGGRQLAEALRQDGSHVPILFTSGYSERSATGTSDFPVGVRFLQKPWTLIDLFAQIRDSLEVGA